MIYKISQISYFLKQISNYNKLNKENKKFILVREKNNKSLLYIGKRDLKYSGEDRLFKFSSEQNQDKKRMVEDFFGFSQELDRNLDKINITLLVFDYIEAIYFSFWSNDILDKFIKEKKINIIPEKSEIPLNLSYLMSFFREINECINGIIELEEKIKDKINVYDKEVKDALRNIMNIMLNIKEEDKEKNLRVNIYTITKHLLKIAFPDNKSSIDYWDYYLTHAIFGYPTHIGSSFWKENLENPDKKKNWKYKIWDEDWFENFKKLIKGFELEFKKNNEVSQEEEENLTLN